ncbi:MAG: hypothetical protein ABI175_13035 [Polyangiales bacterium]
MTHPDGKHHPSPSTLLHHIVELETYARGNGLDQEADELHAISARMRVAMESERPDPDLHVLSLDDARRVLEAIRREREEGPLEDIQRALA